MLEDHIKIDQTLYLGFWLRIGRLLIIMFCTSFFFAMFFKIVLGIQ